MLEKVKDAILKMTYYWYAILLMVSLQLLLLNMFGI